MRILRRCNSRAESCRGDKRNMIFVWLLSISIGWALLRLGDGKATIDLSPSQDGDSSVTGVVAAREPRQHISKRYLFLIAGFTAIRIALFSLRTLVTL